MSIVSSDWQLRGVCSFGVILLVCAGEIRPGEDYGGLPVSSYFLTRFVSMGSAMSDRLTVPA